MVECDNVVNELSVEFKIIDGKDKVHIKRTLVDEFEPIEFDRYLQELKRKIKEYKENAETLTKDLDIYAKVEQASLESIKKLQAGFLKERNEALKKEQEAEKK